MSRPILSILIPAYEYPEGVIAILNQLQCLPKQLFEILIFDDSDNDGVKDCINNFLQKTNLQIKYKNNNKKTGPVNNWNELLREAKGKYLWLIHHDEIPNIKSWVELERNLIQGLATNIKIFHLNVICKDNKSHVWNHCKFFYKKKFIFNPSILVKANFIGPTAAVIVRNEFVPEFNKEFIWLVDVDWYLNLFSTINEISQGFISEEILSITSTVNRIESITQKIKKNRDHFYANESKIITEKYKLNRIQIKFKLLIFVWKKIRQFQKIKSEK